MLVTQGVYVNPPSERRKARTEERVSPLLRDNRLLNVLLLLSASKAITSCGTRPAINLRYNVKALNDSISIAATLILAPRRPPRWKLLRSRGTNVSRRCFLRLGRWVTTGNAQPRENCRKRKRRGKRYYVRGTNCSEPGLTLCRAADVNREYWDGASGPFYRWYNFRGTLECSWNFNTAVWKGDKCARLFGTWRKINFWLK